MADDRRRPTIVVGYDGSQASRAAVEIAAQRAGSGGRVIVVHAYDLPPDFLGTPNYGELLTERQVKGRAMLDALSLESGGESPGVEFETDLVGGAPAETIAAVASARDADEIVIGARGLGRVRTLLGSVSLELLHRADRPVTVIPAAAVERSE